MKTFTNPTDFVNRLKVSTKVKFESSELRATVERIEPVKSKREIMIRYYHPTETGWQSFSFFASQFLSHIIDDFNYECGVFAITN